MFGVLVNTVLVLVGSLLGSLLKRGLPEKLSNAIMIGVGLSVMYIGFSGSLQGQNTLILIISICIGACIGTLIDIDGRLNCLSDRLCSHFAKGKNSNLSQGFVTATMVFCIGAMAIVGPLNAGLSGNNEMLYTKSVLDLITSFVLSSTFGIGVAFAAVSVFVFQGAIALLSGVIAPLLTETVIAEITCTGSVLIFALGLNLIGVTKIKIMNYVPAIFIPIILCLFM